MLRWLSEGTDLSWLLRFLKYQEIRKPNIKQAVKH